MIRSLGAAMLVLMVTLPISAFAKDEIYTGFFSDKAVGGYDTVAYFTESEPVKGKDQFSYEYKGATWLFGSQENLDKFKMEPQTYAPQYGGYCAWAVAMNKTAKGDPKYWNIEDGKLYLNYNQDIQSKWVKDKPGFITKANQNWPGVLN